MDNLNSFSFLRFFGTGMLLLISFRMCGQEKNSTSIAQIVYLDSVVVKATKEGFNIDDFIELIISDTSFYQAFKNIRRASFQLQSDIVLTNRKQDTLSQAHTIFNQVFDGSCRQMDTVAFHSDGKFFKRKGKYKYYTAKLLDRVFFTHGRQCISKKPIALDKEGNLSGEERKANRHLEELKILMFSPGEAANVPLMGDKTAIFTEEMRRYYDYKIEVDSLRGHEVFVFTASVKPEWIDNEHRTVIKYLKIYIDRQSLGLLGKAYRLAYQTIPYGFDIRLDVSLKSVQDGRYYPTSVVYDGFWRIPIGKYEEATFQVEISDFH